MTLLRLVELSNFLIRLCILLGDLRLLLHELHLCLLESEDLSIHSLLYLPVKHFFGT